MNKGDTVERKERKESKKTTGVVQFVPPPIEDARAELKMWLVRHTGCAIQGPNSDWPCGTCICHFLHELGVKEDGDHNTPIDRVNEVWRAILQMREVEDNATETK